MHSSQALPQAEAVCMKRQCAQSGASSALMPFSFRNSGSIREERLVSVDAKSSYAVAGWSAGMPRQFPTYGFARQFLAPRTERIIPKIAGDLGAASSSARSQRLVCQRNRLLLVKHLDVQSPENGFAHQGILTSLTSKVFNK